MPEMMNLTFGGLLDQVAREYPDNLAFKYTDRDYKRTYLEFKEECDKAARGFMAMGIGKGDHVSIWATNIPEWFITFFAAVKIGAVLVTVNTNYQIFELEYLLRQSDTKCLVMGTGFKKTDYLELVNQLCPTLKDSEPGQLDDSRLPFLKTIIYCSQERPAGCYRFSDLFDMAEQTPEEEYQALTQSLDPHDVANMQYTSGTTGFPKGVMLTHYNVINNGKVIGDGMKFTSEDKLCICVPMFHCFGMVLAMTASITHATAMVPIDVYQPLKVLQALQDEECTACHGVPTMFINMLEHPQFREFHFPKMRTGIMAGSPCPIKVMKQVVEEIGMRDIVIVFGQTEASPGCTMTTTEDSLEARVATVGRAFPGVECKIIDIETGETLGPGEQGEFCARGYNIMRGYYKMPEATAQAIDKDGWLHTGDIAMVDEDGYYKVTGRIKDMIIRGGENIYPKEIEDFIYTHPKVKDVQVIGVPSKKYGEEIMACIIVKDGETLTEEEVKEYVRKNLSFYKIPSYVWFMDEFAMNAAGKIQKYKMREAAIQKFNLGEAASIETA